VTPEQKKKKNKKNKKKKKQEEEENQADQSKTMDLEDELFEAELSKFKENLQTIQAQEMRKMIPNINESWIKQL
jgi:hypothetical protein